MPANPTPPAGLLSGQRCLIVGATSGIGLAAARAFIAAGARLAVCGLEEAARIAADIGAHFGISADATDPQQVERLVTQSIDALGGLDILYHVAGGSGRRWGDGPLHECTITGWQKTLELNLTSTFLTNRSVVRHFLAGRQAGVILNMASVLAVAPVAEYFDTCAYAAAKGGVIALSRQLAARYAVHGIRVNVLAPGLIATPMAQRAVADPAIQAYLTAKQPLAAGPGRADDLAGAAVFMCSGASRLLTGVVLPVDAGWQVSEGANGLQAGTVAHQPGT